MSAETSRKYAWITQVEAIRSISVEQFMRMADDVTNAANADAFSQETKDWIEAHKDDPAAVYHAIAHPAPE